MGADVYARAHTECPAQDELPAHNLARGPCGATAAPGDRKHRRVNSPATRTAVTYMKNRSITKKTEAAALVVTARIARQILVVRGQKVMIDANLAALYDVPNKRLNEQVKCNPGRFPADFVFQLSRVERDEVIANCDHLRRLKFSPTMPFAFTEHGALMAASVLNMATRSRDFH
jgi:hypothetical protein